MSRFVCLRSQSFQSPHKPRHFCWWLRFRHSRSISRILSPTGCNCSQPRRMTTIPLAPSLLAGSCDLPGDFGRTTLKRLPIWSCSVRGLACHSSYNERGALLPHHFTLTTTYTQRVTQSWRYVFCATFLQVTLTGHYPAHYPTEFGLSSPSSNYLDERGDRLAAYDGFSKINYVISGSHRN